MILFYDIISNSNSSKLSKKQYFDKELLQSNEEFSKLITNQMNQPKDKDDHHHHHHNNHMKKEKMNNMTNITNTGRLKVKPYSFRFIYSLTTTPKRLPFLEITLNSLFHSKQLYYPDMIYINLPKVLKRTNEIYPNNDNLLIQYPFLNHSHIYINHCDDYGPITKLYPILHIEKEMNTLIVIVDDDTFYHCKTSEYLIHKAIQYPNFVISSGNCNDKRYLLFNESIYLNNPYSYISSIEGCCCRLFEGYNAVAYRRSFFNSPDSNISFNDYINTILKNPYCYRSDDYIISNYILGIQHIQGLNINLRHIQQEYGFHKDALHMLNGWNEHPYVNCSNFLESKQLQFIKAFNGRVH